jgi:hypothetical protein
MRRDPKARHVVEVDLGVANEPLFSRRESIWLGSAVQRSSIGSTS